MAEFSKLCHRFTSYLNVTKMIDLRHWMRIFVLWALVGTFSFITAAKLAYSWFRKRGNYFYVKPHKKPAVLNEFKDGYFDLSVRFHSLDLSEICSFRKFVFTMSRPEIQIDRKCCLFMVFLNFGTVGDINCVTFKKDYHVIALDMRGYNESDKPHGIDNYRIDRLVKDLDEVIQQLGGKTTLIGHDWGAIVCWSLAAERPSIIDKLIIMNVPEPRAFRHVISTSARQLLASWYMFMFQAPYLPESVFRAEDLKTVETMLRKSIKDKAKMTDDDIEAYKYALSQPYGLTGPLNYYRAAPRYMHDVHRQRELTGLIQSKTLIIWGELDTALTVAGAHASLRFCADAQLKLIPTASHFVQEDEPEKVNAYIEDFIAQVDWPTLDDATAKAAL
ncbi:AB hydrolase-1 domain-containing protein [Aphelenchoides besseyi]|nr:AB hydrolase-1 domain-containing protein [Aphelenchoides besseyi]